MGQSGIYAIKHIASGKTYYGQAANFSRRWTSHRSQLNRGKHKNTHLQHAWAKYGAEAFCFCVLEFVPVEHLDERENTYLQTHVGTDLCYNLSRDATASARGLIRSEATKAKISEANAKRTGWHHSEETKRKMSQAHIGKKVSQETRQRMSASSKNRVRGPRTAETKQKLREKNGTPVIGIDLKTGLICFVFLSCSEGAAYGFSPAHISSCVRGNRRQHKGYIWKSKGSETEPLQHTTESS